MKTMQLHYTGPVKKSFGLQLKNGERIRVQPGQPFTIGAEDGQHVLRRWAGLFKEEAPPVVVVQPEPPPVLKPRKSARRTPAASSPTEKTE